MSTALDARYGRTPGSRLRARWVAAIVGGAVAIVVVAWVLWAGLFGTSASIETQDIGATVVDASTIDLREQVTVDPGTRVTCTFSSPSSDGRSCSCHPRASAIAS